MEFPASANRYCPFCGVILQHDIIDYLVIDALARSKRHWTAEVRAIFRCNAPPSPPSLTGSGILFERHTLHAPFDSGLSYTDTNTLEPVTLCQSRGSLWGYGFHDSCWKLLLAKLSYLNTCTTSILEFIFTLLHNTPCRDWAVFEFGHDYGGGATTHKLYGRPLPIDSSSPPYSDPLTIPSEDQLAAMCPSIAHLDLPCRADAGGWQTKDGKSSPIIALPPELMYFILSYLPLLQVRSARLVCRRFAQIAKRENLPQSFWKSRFTVALIARFWYGYL
ncbi:hypothetical protein AJ80_06163 [Polytolypa hystricis UAMH7299]|uniref:F-box domain-containing protein n=1 Tax=Polytolypa hystricis (strain UAMH7299) TaxID=1447883 RepID=A0A2B7XQ46_POLH7|nr:hypothetical protein AJ80_06163 [Polytolypa hystricis UAMH7299]